MDVVATLTRDDVSAHLGMELADLYGLLLPAGETELFSRGGMIARGQSILRARSEAIRRVVCPERAANLDTLDLGVLIATSLAADPALGRLPVLPVTAIVLKIGLDSFCDEGTDHGLA
jgi:hypothetical protein